MGKYLTYQELKQHHREGIDYRVNVREGGSGIAVIAPHGGEIEPGTKEIADDVAGTEHTFYCFEGIKEAGNSDLHITSEKFDKPRMVSIASKEELVLTVHGCDGEREVVYVGGLHKNLKQKIRAALSHAGFSAEESLKPMMEGKSSWNICNRGRARAGVQLEISKGLRKQMFLDVTSCRGRGKKTDVFHKFVFVLKKALSGNQVQTFD
jgi:phage replication-related protein YjqB (UPF0714/DUF867 family)